MPFTNLRANALCKGPKNKVSQLLGLAAFGILLAGPLQASVVTIAHARNSGDWANGLGDHGRGETASSTVPGELVNADAWSYHWFRNGWTGQTQDLAIVHNHIVASSTPGYMLAGAAGGMNVGSLPSGMSLGWPHSWNSYAAVTSQIQTFWNDGWTVHAPVNTVVQVKVSGRLYLDLDYRLVNAAFDQIGYKFEFAFGGTAASAGGISFDTKAVLPMAAFGGGVPWEVTLNLPTNESREIASSIVASVMPASGAYWPNQSVDVAGVGELRAVTTNIEILVPGSGMAGAFADSFATIAADNSWYLSAGSGALVKTSRGYNYLAAEQFLTPVPEVPSAWGLMAGLLLLRRRRSQSS